MALITSNCAAILSPSIEWPSSPRIMRPSGHLDKLLKGVDRLTSHGYSPSFNYLSPSRGAALCPTCCDPHAAAHAPLRAALARSFLAKSFLAKSFLAKSFLAKELPCKELPCKGKWHAVGRARGLSGGSGSAPGSPSTPRADEAVAHHGWLTTESEELQELRSKLASTESKLVRACSGGALGWPLERRVMVGAESSAFCRRRWGWLWQRSQRTSVARSPRRL